MSVTVAYGVDLDLLAYQIFIYKDRMILRDPVDDADKFVDIVIADRRSAYPVRQERRTGGPVPDIPAH